MSRVAVIEWASETAHQVPLGSKIGFVVMVFGLVADLIAHLNPALDHHHAGASGQELSAHLIVFIGMTLVLVGVVIDGVRPGRRSGGNAGERR